MAVVHHFMAVVHHFMAVVHHCMAVVHHSHIPWLWCTIYISVYCTSHYTMNVSQTRPFIENSEGFRKFCHGGCTWNSYA